MQLEHWLASASAKVLRLFIRPPVQRKSSAWILIIAMTSVVSTADYLAGVEPSLSMFYLIPISLTAGWFGWKAGLLVASASTGMRLVGDVISVSPAPLPGHIWWNVGAALVIFIFVTWIIDLLATSHRGLEGRIATRTSELADSIADRRRLEIELLDVTARERAAIGRELHDELGQHLVATAMAAQVLARQLGEERGGNEARAIVSWIEQAIAKTRKLARGLLLARIDADRLPGELEELAANATHAGIRCRVVQQGARLNASAGDCAQLFRIAQEAIGNAMRHGRPRSIEVTLATDENATCLIVADDGPGFVRAVDGTGMGLRIMEHRAQIIGASLAVLSQPGEGTKVICRLPNKPRS